MNVHVIGGGGREHALRIILGRTATIVDTADEADLVVVGPEVPLVAGIADELRAKGKLVFGPGASGARLEGSKAFMKDFVARAGVPTARHGSFDDAETAIAFMKTLPPPYVVKTDGLAAGKGVFISDDFDAAVSDIHDKLSGASFGDAGRQVVVEEGMVGFEFSVFYVFDGTTGFAFAPAQDFKRIGDHDTGPNTGGMGAYSPVPELTEEAWRQTVEQIFDPTCRQLQADGIDYRGVLYASIMLTADGPKLIEYNVRFGDPDGQVSLLRFPGDLAQVLADAAAGKLQVPERVADDQAVVNIVLASAGYPLSSRSGDVIRGVDDAGEVPGVTVLLAGTTTNEDGELVTNGGRVLNVVAVAPTLTEARQRAYEATKRIHFEGMQYRTDIALKAADSQ